MSAAAAVDVRREPAGGAFFQASVVAITALVPIAGWAVFGARPISHCPAGLVAIGARCCGEGQTAEGGHCHGTPRACAATQSAEPDGCVAVPARVRIEPDASAPTPEAGVATDAADAPRVAFEIDAFEVTAAAFATCVDRGACPPRDRGEPGLPVTGVDATEAAAFCVFAGGRLPTYGELVFAARGAEARRYPWGPTGAVCRRAVWGLVSGPCNSGGASPEIAGARPDGGTPGGVFDLAGNVRELTAARGSGTADQVRVYGGSFRSLGTFTLLSSPPPSFVSPHGRADDLGFRCAYDVPG